MSACACVHGHMDEHRPRQWCGYPYTHTHTHTTHAYKQWTRTGACIQALYNLYIVYIRESYYFDILCVCVLEREKAHSHTNTREKEKARERER